MNSHLDTNQSKFRTRKTQKRFTDEFRKFAKHQLNLRFSTSILMIPMIQYQSSNWQIVNFISFWMHEIYSNSNVFPLHQQSFDFSRKKNVQHGCMCNGLTTENRLNFKTKWWAKSLFVNWIPNPGSPKFFKTLARNRQFVWLFANYIILSNIFSSHPWLFNGTTIESSTAHQNAMNSALESVNNAVEIMFFPNIKYFNCNKDTSVRMLVNWCDCINKP